MTTVSILAGTGSSGYNVSNSLRFRSSASATLTRTPASAGNRQKWTWSGWVKLGTLSVTRVLFGAGQNATTGIDFGFQSDNTFFYAINAVGSWSTTAVFRDPSAWYHVVFAFDSTQATQANRSIVYINGVNYAFSSNGVVLNNNYDVNNTIAQYFSYSGVSGTPQYLDGYVAEVNFIDGQQLTASSFGTYDTNGVWQPINYSGTYGTNGFHLTFGNTSSVANLGLDSSGNSNTWTVNNVSLTAGTTYDSMIDSPTVSSASVANYAVMNPLALGSTVTMSNGNLTMTEVGTYATTTSTIAITSGKWYAEMTAGSNTYGGAAGIAKLGYSPTTRFGFQANTWNYNNDGGLYYNSTLLATVSSYTTGDVIGVAFDATNLTIAFYKNNVLQTTQFTAANSGLAAGQFYFATGHINSTSNWNFGQQPFTYTPPTGFNSLNTYNLPTPTILNGSAQMAATLYTGTGATATISNATNNSIGTTFQPDFVWIKSRSAATNNNLFDIIRGTTAYINSNTTAISATNANTLTAFGSTGFTLGSDASAIGVNVSAATYDAWQWKASNAAGVTNTNGSITSTVSANQTAGFSIVTYTGTGAVGTVGHGLASAPNMIFIKKTTGTTANWAVYHSSVGNGAALSLNQTTATNTTVAFWNNTSPTSTVFTLATSGDNNASGTTQLAYCWTAVAGYSAFGSYTGNGSTDGPFVYTGFRPRFVMTKRTDSTSDWLIFDTSRNTYNVANSTLLPNSSGAEITDANRMIDFVSNGFKVRSALAEFNGSGNNMIYAAFAENPFNSSRAR